MANVEIQNKNALKKLGRRLDKIDAQLAEMSSIKGEILQLKKEVESRRISDDEYQKKLNQMLAKVERLESIAYGS